MSPLKITMIGTGYVGLVSGTCFAELGHTVTCIDKDEEKIAKLRQGQIPIFEEKLEEMVRHNVQQGRLTFETNLPSAIENSDVIFIAVGTPTRPEDGSADLSYITTATKDIAPFLTQYKVIVIKSTVPIGTCHIVKNSILNFNPNADFDIVSNPEFLREGSAVQDFIDPDRIIIGSESTKARDLMNIIYNTFVEHNIPILHTDLESSELIKYTANCFLATKIAFINEIATLCEKTGANIENVVEGIGLDKRIGKGFLQPGPGFGGSCFPKDTLALAHFARTLRSPLTIVDTVIRSNEERKKLMLEKVVEACHKNVAGKKIAILGIAFKANTDDSRESPSLVIIEGLQRLGATIIAYDPAVKKEKQPSFPEVIWASSAKKALQKAEMAVIVTEWDEFKRIDFASFNHPITIVDLRNLYDPKAMAKAGIPYFSIGRKSLVKTSKFSFQENVGL